MGEKRVIDFLRVHLLAAPVDELLDAAGEEKVALGIEISVIAV